MKAQEKKGWQRLIRLANADPSDDRELAKAFWNLLRALVGAPLAIDGLPCTEWHESFIPDLAREARSVQPRLQILLRWVAGAATKAQGTAAPEIMAKSRYELVSVYEGRLVSETAIRVETDDKGEVARYVEFRPRSERRASPRRWHQAPDYREALDLVCGFIRQALDQQPERESIRLCHLPSCGKFFMRWRRRRYCPTKCRPAYNSARRKPVKAAVRRFRQQRWEMRKLRREKGRAALKARIEEVKRKKIGPEKRRRLLAILRDVLSE